MSFLLSPLSPSSLSRDPAGEGTRPGWGAMVGAACLPAGASYLVAVVVLAMLTAAVGADSSVAGVAGVAGGRGRWAGWPRITSL